MRSRSRAFTIVELAIVLAIGGLLIAMTWSAVERYLDRSRVSQAVLDIGEMSKTIRQYEIANGALPAALTDVALDAKEDPWGQGYVYVNLRTAPSSVKARKDKALKPLNSDFDLYSVGPDGLTAASLNKPESRDDVVRARDGGFIGTAEEFDP